MHGLLKYESMEEIISSLPMVWTWTTDQYENVTPGQGLSLTGNQADARVELLAMACG